MKMQIVVLMLAALTLSGCIETKTGEDYGYIIAVNGGGFLAKTTEVYVKTSHEATDTYVYCLDDEADSYDDLLEQVKAAAEGKYRVKISIHKELIVAWWRCNDAPAGIIDSIERVED